MTIRPASGWTLLLLGPALGAYSVCAVPGRAMAEERSFPSELPAACNQKNVAGTFGFNQKLFAAASTGEPAAVVGILDLRPDGEFTLQFRAFVKHGGDLITSLIYVGEWTIEPDCVGFVDFEGTVSTLGPVVDIDFQFVAVENGTEPFSIRNDPLAELDAKLFRRREARRPPRSGLAF